MKTQAVVSNNIRLRNPALLSVGKGSIIDDFCYFSTRVRIGRFCHIANGVSIAGGRDRCFSLGDYSSISAGARIWCRSDNFVSDLAALVPEELTYPKNEVIGDVTFGDMTILGCNSVVMPGNFIPQGVAVGALSFVPSDYRFEPWAVYAGIPIRRIRPRDRESVESQKRFLERRYQDILDQETR